VERAHNRDCCSNGGEHEPGATLEPEIRDGAPEKINRVRESDQGADAGGAGWIYTFIAQKKRERTANEAEGDDGIRRNEEGEKPRAFAWRRFALGVDIRP
jgi:hypothetical protein